MTVLPVILFGDDIAGYGVIRALGPKQIPIYIVSRTGKGICTRSKYKKQVLILDPKDDGFFQKLMAWLARKVGTEAVLIVSGDDEYLDALSKNYDSLGPNLKPTFPPWDIVRRVRHKRETYAIAEKIGIPVPKTIYITSRSELEGILRDGLNIKFPLLMKSEESIQFCDKYRTKGVISNNEEHLIENFDKYEGFYGKLLLQEMVPGGENRLLNFIGIYNRNSEPIQVFMNRKRRSYRQFLSCTLMETMWSREILEYSNRLIKEIGYFGYVNPEYKYDERDGQIKLIEINGRVSKSNSHALRCGLNVIWTLYEEVLEGPLKAQNTFEMNYPYNVLWWTPIDDCIAAIKMLGSGLLGYGEYIKSLKGSKYIMEPINFKDPCVFGSYLLSILNLLLKKAKGRKNN